MPYSKPLTFNQNTFNIESYSLKDTLFLMPHQLYIDMKLYEKESSTSPFQSLLIWAKTYCIDQNIDLSSPLEQFSSTLFNIKSNKEAPLINLKENQLVVIHTQCLSDNERIILKHITCKKKQLYQSDSINNTKQKNISFSLVEDSDCELSLLIKTIREVKENSKDISILYPSYYPKTTLIQKLKAFNIPCQLIDTQSIGKNILSTHIINYLASQFQNNDALLAYALCYPKQGIGEHLTKQSKQSLNTYLLENKHTLTLRKQHILNAFFNQINYLSQKNPLDFLKQLSENTPQIDPSILLLYKKLFAKLDKKHHIACFFYVHLNLLAYEKDGITCLAWASGYPLSFKRYFILGAETIHHSNGAQSKNLKAPLAKEKTHLIGSCKRSLDDDHILCDLYSYLEPVVDVFIQKEAQHHLSAKLLLKQFPKAKELTGIKPNYQAEQIDFTFYKGQYIHHDQWGAGKILDISYEQESPIYTIDFNKEQRKINAKFSSIRLV